MKQATEESQRITLEAILILDSEEDEDRLIRRAKSARFEEKSEERVEPSSSVATEAEEDQKREFSAGQLENVTTTDEELPTANTQTRANATASMAQKQEQTTPSPRKLHIKMMAKHKR